LGPLFLKRFYLSLTSSHDAIVLVALDGTRIEGFICGAMDTNKVYKRILLRSWTSMLPVLLPKLLSWQRIRKSMETVFYPKKKENRNLPKSEILNFCIRSSSQRKGIGSMLFRSLTAEFQKNNIDRIKIVTGENQRNAQMFYARHHARKVCELEVHKNVKSFIYVLDINSTFS
jgi:ribosomal protein S18 acetylase RimI-like enzyme